MYFIGRGLCRLYLTVMGGYRSFDEENIPKKGGVLLAPNHMSYLDPPLVGAGMKRQVHFMAKEPLFRIPVLGRGIRAVGAFPVRQKTADRTALKTAIELLSNGKVVCVFPEGTRNDEPELLTPELGFAMIALKSGAPVVPCAIFGTHKALAPKKPKPGFARVKIVYGKPMTFDDLLDNPGREALEEVGKRVSNAIAELRKIEPK